MQQGITGAAAGGTARADQLTAEKSKLRQYFGRVDIFFFLVCTLVGVDGLGQLTTKGNGGPCDRAYYRCTCSRQKGLDARVGS